MLYRPENGSPRVCSGHRAAPNFKGARKGSPPKSLFCSFACRYFDEPIGLRSSSFSNWDDSSDFYWKKETVKDTDTALKTTGYSDRYGQQNSGLVNSEPMDV